MKRIPIVLLALLCMLLASAASGCQRAGMPARTEIVISAASSLAACMDELKELYESRNATVELKLNYGGSGGLQRQIELGAPVHLFLSAGEQPIQLLVDKGYMEEVQNLFANRLVAIVRADSELAIHSVEELARSGIDRLAIGEPATVPAGQYARQSLQHDNLWETLKPSLIFTKDVRQALQVVETGNADAAYVYETDAISSNKVRIAFYADPVSHSPIIYPAGLVKGSENREAALDFLRYLMEDEAQQVIRKHGFYISENGG